MEGVPTRPIVKPALPKHRVTVWATDDYIDQLLPHCNPRLAALVQFMTYTGFRTGEALRLEPRSFRMRAGYVLVARTKNSEPAFVPVPEVVLDAIHKIMPDSGPVFGWTTSQGFNRALRTACRRAGLAFLSGHKVGRHAFAARLFGAGYDIKTVKEAGRWKKLQVVDESYGHLDHRQAHEAMLAVVPAKKVAEK
jgi:integrase